MHGKKKDNGSRYDFMSFYKNFFLPAALAAGVAFSGCGRPDLISSERRNGITKYTHETEIDFFVPITAVWDLQKRYPDQHFVPLETTYVDELGNGLPLDRVEIIHYAGNVRTFRIVKKLSGTADYKAESVTEIEADSQDGRHFLGNYALVKDIFEGKQPEQK